MTFKYHFGVGRFNMLLWSYTFADGFSLYNFLQVWLIANQSYEVTPFRYINQTDEVYRLVITKIVLEDMKYLMRSVK